MGADLAGEGKKPLQRMLIRAGFRVDHKEDAALGLTLNFQYLVQTMQVKRGTDGHWGKFYPGSCAHSIGKIFLSSNYVTGIV